MVDNQEQINISLEQMSKSGVHLGHHKSKWHPKMKDYIYGSKSNIHIIDLEQTEKKLQEALTFLDKVVSSGKDVLFISTKKQANPIIKLIALETGMPYVIKRWVGGTFSNFRVITKRVRQLVQLEDKLEKGKLESYTKKERKVFSDRVMKGNKLFEGLKDMKALPGVIFVQDISRDYLAIKEARDLKIPVIALADTNVNPNLVDYAIPANDDGVSSINYIYGLVRDVVIKSKLSRKQVSTKLDKVDKLQK